MSRTPRLLLFARALTVAVPLPLGANSNPVVPPHVEAKAPSQLAQATPNEATLMREGKVIFVKTCSECHGVQGEGHFGPRLVNSAVVASKVQLIGQLFAGTEDGMSPAYYNVLSDREIAAVSTYVRNSWGNNFGALLPEEVAVTR